MAKRARLMDAPHEPAVQAEARRRRRALERILRERRQLSAEAHGSPPLRPDPLEAAQTIEEEQVWLAVLDQSHEARRQVDEAMQLLAEGRYGECVDCGVSIPPARLRALPFALRCLPCQEHLEARRQNKPAFASSTSWGSIESE